ncbi:MAG: hypothetical protein KKE20_06030 [Nanoarchaeota archaeon]|nr:hypothetical protein [Nanoarchaeota archaeon]
MMDISKEAFAAIFKQTNEESQYQRPEKPFEISVLGRGEGIIIPDQDLEFLLSCARWDLLPPFAEDGRSAWLQRRESLKLDDATVYNYKLKGIAISDRGIIKPPSDERFQRFFEGEKATLIHMGFGEGGSLISVADPPNPVGGLKAGRGEREFNNARRLYDAGVPAVLPICWGKYNQLFFEGKNMEFVFLGIPMKSELRADGLFLREERKHELGDELLATIKRMYSTYSEKKKNLYAWRFLDDVAYSLGEALHDFHWKAGLVRYAGHSGNYGYDKDKKRVVLHDLDSSISHEEIPEETVGLSMIRDLASASAGLFKLYTHLFFYAKVKAEKRLKKNAFNSLFTGYFKEGDAKLIRDMGKSVQLIFEDHLATLVTKKPNMAAWYTESHDKALMYVPPALMVIYERTDLTKSFPLPYKAKEYLDRYIVYQKERSEFVKKVLAGVQ